jgi:glyoxylase-like metal-dependent hydrolase (beta-lactamase superfamily II)
VAVLASPKAIPLLADPTYNNILGDGPYESIQAVTPVSDGDMVDLGGIALEILEAAGHSVEHIAVMDQKNRNLLAGDAIGLKLGDDTFLPPFMPPSWDPDAFRSTIDKLKQTDYDSLCLAHYGCIYGGEAKSIPDDALRVTERWWQLFTDNRQRLDDAEYLFELVMNEIGPRIPDLGVLQPATGEASGELFLRGLIAKLALGYRLAERTARADMTQMVFGPVGNA